MAINRKGVFFTLMALLLVAFLLMYQKAGQATYSPTRAETDAARVRTGVMNTYLLTFEQHAGDSLRTSGYLTLQNLSWRVNKNGAYLQSINKSVQYCMSNKTTDYNCLSINQTVNTSLSRLAAIARSNLSIETRYIIENVWVTEEEPFEVIFWMNISYNISDSFASWQRKQTIRTVVDVTNLTDPVYAYELSQGTLLRSRQIRQTPYRGLQFDNTTFTTFYRNEQYLHVPTAPSVLQRYQGNLSGNSTCCGIESVVRAQFVNAAVLAQPKIVNWSFVDYQFFQRTSPGFEFDCNSRDIGRLKNPADFPDKEVRLDTNHLFNIYHVNGSAVYSCINAQD